MLITLLIVTARLDIQGFTAISKTLLITLEIFQILEPWIRMDEIA